MDPSVASLNPRLELMQQGVGGGPERCPRRPPLQQYVDQPYDMQESTHLQKRIIMHLVTTTTNLKDTKIKQCHMEIRQRNLPVDAVQSRTISPSDVVASINICMNIGSFSLAPLHGISSRIS